MKTNTIGGAAARLLTLSLSTRTLISILKMVLGLCCQTSLKITLATFQVHESPMCLNLFLKFLNRFHNMKVLQKCGITS